MCMSSVMQYFDIWWFLYACLMILLTTFLGRSAVAFISCVVKSHLRQLTFDRVRLRVMPGRDPAAVRISSSPALPRRPRARRVA